jgi:hypothetical protein
VLHSLRHTALTRLGETGADAFTIVKLAGCSSVTVSQRYMHPGETVQLGFDRVEALNSRALEASSTNTMCVFRYRVNFGSGIYLIAGL